MKILRARSSSRQRMFGPRPSRTLEKINRFASLPTGWHTGGGQPIKHQVLARAKAVYFQMQFVGFSLTDAFAGRGGEVLITGYHTDHYVSVTVELDSYTLNYEVSKREVIYREGLTLRQVKSGLRKIADLIWNSSEYSTRETSTTSSGSSTIWLSSNTATGFRVSMPPAQKRVVGRYAII